MSMVPAGSGPRRVARKLTTEALFRPGIIATFSVVLVAVILVIVGSYEISGVTGHPWSPVIVAFALGAGVASVGWSIIGAVLFLDGSWSWRVGVLGEQSTAEVLASLPGAWAAEHNIPYWYSDGRREWDVDHVVVGPAGVVVMDTKWTSDPCDPCDQRTASRLRPKTVAVATQAAQIAKEIEAAAGRVSVTPALVCWGPRLGLPEGGAAEVDGVWVVAGPALAGWLHRLPEHPLGDVATDAAVAVLRKRISDHERWRAKGRTAAKAAPTAARI